jgi:hypothetical protein
MSASDDLTLYRPEAPPRVLFSDADSDSALAEPKDTWTPYPGWYFAFRIDIEATLPFLRSDTISAFLDASKVYVGYLENVRLFGPEVVCWILMQVFRTYSTMDCPSLNENTIEDGSSHYGHTPSRTAWL